MDSNAREGEAVAILESEMLRLVAATSSTDRWHSLSDPIRLAQSCPRFRICPARHSHHDQQLSVASWLCSIPIAGTNAASLVWSGRRSMLSISATDRG